MPKRIRYQGLTAVRPDLWTGRKIASVQAHP